MLIGLRKAWTEPHLRDETTSSQKEPITSSVLFHHENLQVYKSALAFMEWFVCLTDMHELSNKLFRQIDEAGTSVALNIAEGNGRYAQLDQSHFIQIAQTAAVKAMVYLDLCVTKAVLAQADVQSGKEILGRISAMLGGF